VVSEGQLELLIDAMRRNREAKVFLGFNRPRSELFKELQRSLVPEQGPLMINWAVVGHEIPEGHWYLDEKEGGRVLGNVCHWTDLTLHLVTMESAFPCAIVPATPAGERNNCLVSLVFADRSCAAITFSAKGHTFEGVRETLCLHKGNVVASLTDFQVLTIDLIERKRTLRPRYRDHGHEANIIHSFDGALSVDSPGEAVTYVAATANLFLAVGRATDSGEKVIVLASGTDDARHYTKRPAPAAVLDLACHRLVRLGARRVLHGGRGSAPGRRVLAAHEPRWLARHGDRGAHPASAAREVQERSARRDRAADAAPRPRAQPVRIEEGRAIPAGSSGTPHGTRRADDGRQWSGARAAARRSAGHAHG
jgi:hypothetical protein